MSNIADELIDSENRALRNQIIDLRDVLESIRLGRVDAVISGEPGAEQVYTLSSADRPYRLIIEQMNEGAATVSPRGVILYANPRLGQMLGCRSSGLVGTAPGKGAIMMAPVSVCHQVSTIGQRLPPMTS